VSRRWSFYYPSVKGLTTKVSIGLGSYQREDVLATDAKNATLAVQGKDFHLHSFLLVCRYARKVLIDLGSVGSL
jgi:hypothetical protein